MSSGRKGRSRGGREGGHGGQKLVRAGLVSHHNWNCDGPRNVRLGGTRERDTIRDF